MKSVLRGVSVLMIVGITSAHAQNVRSWVASSGVDTNDCSRANPCRTFGRALEVSNPNAEIVALDSGGYGPVVIDRAIQIIAPPGVHAAIAPTAGDAIRIAVGGLATVALRGLFLNGQGATTGIAYMSGRTVHVEKMVIANFESGMTATRTVLASPGELVLEDVTVRGCESYGLIAYAPASSSRVAIAAQNCRFERNNTGVEIGENVRATFHSSLATLSGSTGFSSRSFGGNAGTDRAELNLTDCVAANNSHGARAEVPMSELSAVSILRVGSSLITNNTSTGLTAGSPGAVVESLGNNLVRGNGIDVAGVTVVDGE